MADIESHFELPEGYEDEMFEAFELFDKNADGFIDFKEMKLLLRSLGLRVNNHEARNVFGDADVSGTGRIDFDSFRMAMAKDLQKREALESKLEHKIAFTLMDTDKTGSLSFANIREAADRVGEVITDEQIDEMIADAAGKGATTVSFQEYSNLMNEVQLW
uniref:EF-hand domain-containing protein n=1 Tax=Rhodosorus marinus TaxID=101924 RepID=A0A7S3A2M9_9RHOD|mmetsp:Transcript_42652/g.166475  ORF Transcript_42652/g.166475 Transcript_42652/m.166475 type:complete len:161 (+) Transcript_42652:80-562(+)|eukprot:CAMPEP_0113969164 /NCGR_PEP_ID=MMETSP0011_2-20120614/10073_1 /TAXON_ID=101924 /ORGANISM="Rhodosorus marinus" /LENGTH=160 /DNA_ID=CAMNT_0000982607 /DNA_START=13 /DNA_END=495 /DNA_ORIENTATION=+ /assembly_acc=CAM_ASM_000156